MSATVTEEMETHQKTRLQRFLSDLAMLGSLQGFYYFQPWMRGNEELLPNVVNEDLRWPSPEFPASLVSSCTSSTCSSSYSLDSYYDSSPLPGEGPQPQPRPQSSQVSQQQPSRSNDLHLLPASPSEREITVPEMNRTLFLLTAYAKYGRPYTWVRSNHERLINVGGADSLAKDTPMKLKSITDSDLAPQGTRVWDVVHELVGLCTMPPPDNPFFLDMCYLKTLSLPERFLTTGALLNFLEIIVVQGSRKESFYDLGHTKVGFSMYFYIYSWKGRAVFMEDLYVMPEFRAKSIGKALMYKVAWLGQAAGCTQLKFAALNWNKSALDFYQNQGSIDLTSEQGYHYMCCHGDAFQKMADRGC